ncbi:hypothetical protein [Sphingomonas sp. 1F27F7B]|nr:hypothetical protein [Sphingomonas sp. 1F27F7B]
MEPRWAGYAEYCRLRAAGLRPQALVALDAFLAAAADWHPADRVIFAKWVTAAADHARSSPLLPDPMVRRMLVPALAEATDDAEARALLGLLGDTHDDAPLALYLDALAQAPDDPVAVKLFLRAVLQWVDYAQHELPGCYLGDPAEDIALLERAATLSTDPDQRNLIDHRLEAARRALTDRNPHGN